MSIQTGTSHGGVVLPDGSIAEVSIDFDTLRRLSAVAREEYGLAGCVQHGASTLPDDAFDHFPANGAAEMHLATGFQNILYDGGGLPDELRAEMMSWTAANCADERKPDETEEQFLYKSRKKAIGPFKRQLWTLPAENAELIAANLRAKFGLLFDELGIAGLGPTSSATSPRCRCRCRSRPPSAGGTPSPSPPARRSSRTTARASDPLADTDEPLKHGLIGQADEPARRRRRQLGQRLERAEAARPRSARRPGPTGASTVSGSRRSSVGEEPLDRARVACDEDLDPAVEAPDELEQARQSDHPDAPAPGRLRRVPRCAPARRSAR